MTELDMQSVLDVTREKFISEFPVRPIIKLKNVRRNGRANWKSNSITIPAWVAKYGENYSIYYILHELTHYYKGSLGGHGPLFKEIENKLLSVWGISIIRAKAYPKTLFANGQEQPSPKTKQKFGII